MIQVHRGPHLPDGLSSPDVYFTPEYGRAVTVCESGEWIRLEAFEGAWQLPLIVRTLSDRTKDAITPHFSGVYASPALSPLQIQEAWSETVACLRELGVISVLIRESPLVPQAPHLPGQQLIVSGHPTFVLEHVDTDEAWTGLVKTCRTKIRKAIKNGYTADVRAASLQDLAAGNDFRRLYEQTMQRVDAGAVYYFTDEYYQALFDGLGPDLFISEVRNHAGVPVCSDLLMRHGKRLHGHLSGSNPQDARMGTSNLSIWATIEFAVDQGIEQFHIGGGITRDDSLFIFKRVFGGREVHYDVSGLILEPTEYQARVKARARECDVTAEALLTSNFFPAYRAERRHCEGDATAARTASSELHQGAARV
jgi:hypothetical protein